MRVLLTGAAGQLGRELVREAPTAVDLAAFDRVALDLTDAGRVKQLVTSIRPHVILNAAAYTAVDRAEKEVAAAEAANRDGVGALTKACAAAGARLVHVSTDFVFDGSKDTPYVPGDPTGPLSVYGRTKLEGEREVERLGEAGVVVRTARVYSALGGNFVTTMLRLMAERDELQVVDDQVGSPTWARGLARTLWRAASASVEGRLSGVHHWCDSGACSFHEFAVEIRELGFERGLTDRKPPVRAVATADYPAEATRPTYSVLDCSSLSEALGVEQLPWRVALGRMLDEMGGKEVQRG